MSETELILEACKTVIKSSEDHYKEIMKRPLAVEKAIYELRCLLDEVTPYSSQGDYLNKCLEKGEKITC